MRDTLNYRSNGRSGSKTRDIFK